MTALAGTADDDSESGGEQGIEDDQDGLEASASDEEGSMEDVDSDEEVGDLHLNGDLGALGPEDDSEDEDIGSEDVSEEDMGDLDDEPGAGPAEVPQVAGPGAVSKAQLLEDGDQDEEDIDGDGLLEDGGDSFGEEDSQDSDEEAASGSEAMESEEEEEEEGDGLLEIEKKARALDRAR